MSSSHTNHIRSLTEDILTKSGLGEPPVDVYKIAETVKLKIVPFDFADSISAVLKKQKLIIGVNKNHSASRQRFSIAHEIGHFLLGHDLGIDENDFIDDRFDKPTPIEREANLFAAVLLMPKGWVEKSVNEKSLDVPRLAREFKVSEQAVTIRLLELNLIK